MGSERRLNKRVNREIPMTFILIDKVKPGILDAPDALKIREGLLVDFSAAGVSMRTTELVDSWTPFFRSEDLLVGIQFKFPFEPRPVCAVTQVMWVKKIPPQKKYYLLGLKFTLINNLDLFKVRKYIIGASIKQKQ
ncbi:MAG: hypothetical protein PHO30_00630 [Candidatus Omnitrophica bacterium]|nr:hypothetical protein [Candidatus Omnitrophota bacterium]